jgi:hypothetical protein
MCMTVIETQGFIFSLTVIKEWRSEARELTYSLLFVARSMPTAVKCGHHVF